MKNKSLKHGLPYFISQRQRIDGKDESNNMPESEWERAEGLMKDLLRWADDGGRMLELGNNPTARSNRDEAREQFDNDGS